MGTEDNKEKIVETALQLFNTRGCKGVTMDDIATSMHISKRTLYKTFANKEELLSECLMRVHDEIESLHHQIFHKVDEPLLVAMYMIRANAIVNHSYHHLIEDSERCYPEIHNRFFKIHSESFRTYIHHGIEYVRQHNYLRPDADIKVAEEFICNLVQQRRMSDVADSREYARYTSEICFTYMRGLMTVDTIARYEKEEAHFRKILEDLGIGDISPRKRNNK
jgi:AcrR family transcriptional regulator